MQVNEKLSVLVYLISHISNNNIVGELAHYAFTQRLPEINTHTHTYIQKRFPYPLQQNDSSGSKRK